MKRHFARYNMKHTVLRCSVMQQCFAKMLLLNMKKSYNAGVLKAFATKMLKEKLIRYDAH